MLRPSTEIPFVTLLRAVCTASFAGSPASNDPHAMHPPRTNPLSQNLDEMQRFCGELKVEWRIRRW
jgi:hypothetical protein